MVLMLTFVMGYERGFGATRVPPPIHESERECPYHSFGPPKVRVMLWATQATNEMPCFARSMRHIPRMGWVADRNCPQSMSMGAASIATGMESSVASFSLAQ